MSFDIGVGLGFGASVKGEINISEAVSNIGKAINNAGDTIADVGSKIVSAGETITNVGSKVISAGRNIAAWIM